MRTLERSWSRRRAPCAALVLLCASLATATVAATPTEYNPAFAADPAVASAESARVIVKFKAGAGVVKEHALAKRASHAEASAATTARAAALAKRVGVALAAGRAIDERAQVVRADGMTSAELAQRLSIEDDVEYAVPDERRMHHAVPNDPLFAQGPPVSGTAGGPISGQWYLRAPSAPIASSINAPAAWDVTTGSASIVVAVLDTGVRPEHPDLAGRLVAGWDMVHDVDAANDADGRDSDPSDPGDWITASEAGDTSGAFAQCTASNSSWHGTMTSSLIGAAANDGVGMAGVAWGVRLQPVRVMGKCGGFDSDILAGMRWASGLSVPGLPANATPARVINMSLGAAGACPQSYVDVVNAIGTKSDPVVVVASAGNSSGHEVGSPANCPGVIAVAALRHAGTKVGFSDLGPQIAISAPGGNCVNTGAGQPCLYPILAASNTGTTSPIQSTWTGSFHPSVGTSFSAPLVAGTAALMLSVNAALAPAAIKSALQAAARPFWTSATPGAAIDATIPACHAPTGTDQAECVCTTSTCGAGMLDAAAAVKLVTPAPDVIEFYNGALDTYFITANAQEAAAIDAGASGPGWNRTGNTFKSAGTAQVCRFYGSLAPGPNSHFYTIDAEECAKLKAMQIQAVASDKHWNFESLDFLSTPTVAGGCPNGLKPVRRAYNNGFVRGVDSNHRITTSAAAIDEVVFRGWIDEGVVMCAP